MEAQAPHTQKKTGSDLGDYSGSDSGNDSGNESGNDPEAQAPDTEKCDNLKMAALYIITQTIAYPILKSLVPNYTRKTRWETVLESLLLSSVFFVLLLRCIFPRRSRCAKKIPPCLKVLIIFSVPLTLGCLTRSFLAAEIEPKTNKSVSEKTVSSFENNIGQQFCIFGLTLALMAALCCCAKQARNTSPEYRPRL